MSDDDKSTDRRTVLKTTAAALGSLATGGYAGRVEADGDVPTPANATDAEAVSLDAPSAVKTVRTPTASNTSSGSFSFDPIDPPEIVIPPGELEIPPGGGPVGNVGGCSRGPTPVTDPGAVEVEVTPNTKQTQDTAVGNKQSNTRGNMVCKTQKRRITEGGLKQFLLNPQLGTIWTGAILEGKSIADGRFSPALSPQRRNGTPVSALRKPIELSITVPTVSGRTDTVVQNPSLGNVRNARNNLLSRFNNSATPARMSAKLKQVHSRDQLNVELGVHFNSNKLSVHNKFNFSNTSRRNKVLAQVWQKYYTIDLSLPNPEANNLVKQQCRYLKPNDVVIKNVSYGRVLLFSAESKYSRQRIKNALRASINAGGKQGSVNFNLNHKKVLKEASISVQVLGGSATNGAKTISKPGQNAQAAFNAIKRWISKGATFDPATSPGVPIAYHAKYPSTLDTANVYLTTTYTARSCRPATRTYRVHNFSWKVTDEDDPGNKEEIYGDIYLNAWPHRKGSSSAPKVPPKGAPSDGSVWDRSRSQHLKIRGGHSQHLGIDERFVFNNPHTLDKANSYIQVTAIPKEMDPLSHDDFGNKKSEKWFLNQAPSNPNTAGSGGGQFTMNWSSHGSDIRLAFDISPQPP